MAFRVSILMPVRDAETTVGRAIESCLEQTLEDFELITVDDGSNDATRGLLEQYRSEDRRVRVVRQPRPGGLVPALQSAFRAARGSLLARMDADDVAYPERLAEQAALLDARPEISACGCRVRIIGSSNGHDARPKDGYRRYEEWINRLVEPEEIASERFVESPIAHPTAMIRRQSFERVRGYRETDWAEDYDLWLRMIGDGMKLAKVPRVLFDWRDHPDRLSRTCERYGLERFRRAKAYYLSRMTGVRSRGVMISGAGPTGKQMARLLLERGIQVHVFLEVNPRRIGKCITGIPVIDSRELPRASATAPIQLAAVGQAGRRENVARWLLALGYHRGRDFYCVA